jgi:hypothetical protein
VFADNEHPGKDAMLRVRKTILADDRLTEAIKWKSPTFTFRGNIASFNPRTKAHVSLMFHTGATSRGDHPRLEGGDTARYMRFTGLEDVESARDDLACVVAA